MSKIVLVLLLIALSLNIGLPSGDCLEEERLLDKYVIYATLIERNKTLLVQETVEFRNKYNVKLKELCFHVYSNAPQFRKSGSLLIINYIKDLNTTQYLNYTLGGIDGTLLVVKLPRPLSPRETKIIKISFSLKIPVRRDRFGYYDDIYALGTWYPILAVYREDRGEWNRAPYYPHGESYNFDFANYDVYLNVSKNMIVAATGVKIEETIENDRKIVHFKAECVREHCIVMSPKFKVKSKKITIEGRTVEVSSYYIPEQEYEGEVALDTAIYSLRLYSDLYGPYPYPILRVCEVHGWFGGMEYPMLIMITSYLYSRERREYLELVVAHEVAHQWWYCIIANDEGEEPWMDEAFAEYSGVLYFEFRYGKSKFKEIFRRTVIDPFYRYLQRNEDDISAKSVWYFGDDVYRYVNIIYNKGACTLHMLRLILGDELFFSSLKKVYREYKFKKISIKDFTKTVEEATGRDLDWFFRAWLYSRGIPRYSIVKAVARGIDRKYELIIVICQLNPDVNITMYVPVTIYGWYGVKYVKLIKVEGSESKAIIKIPFEPRFVRVDEEDVILGKDNSVLVPVEIKYFTLSREEVQVQVGSLLLLILLDLVLFIRLSKRGTVK
ncbi:MAG: hypothetical protein DRJ49_00740 [Thermoprotei archaeon]|nr:MAG: hypothetical protein DRJ49_00740 [Thermoprotei archaeon]